MDLHALQGHVRKDAHHRVGVSLSRTHNDLFHAESLYFEGLHFELHVQCDDGVIVVHHREGKGQTYLYVVCYGGCSVRR